MIGNFHFLQPYWLLLFPAVLVLALLIRQVRLNRSHWSAVCDPELLPLLEQQGGSRSVWLSASLTLAALILTVAAAQPVWKQLPQPVFKQGDALVIALDLSTSMNATDLKPSRLQRAQFKIRDLLARIPDAEVALLVYAADAFSVTPLTEDSATILAQLPAMTPEIMPGQGSRADRALQLADELLTQAGINRGNILLISDEVLPAQIAATAARLRTQGRQLSILAVGTEQGSPVPTGNGLLKDQQGRVVVARTQMADMREAAGLGGGQAVMITLDDRDISTLANGFQHGDEAPVETRKKIQRWVAEGPWLVLLALPLLLPLFRRGILNLLLPAILPAALLAATGYSDSAQAASASGAEPSSLWENLWQTPDQQARQLYQSGDKQSAAERFEDPRWKQLSHYETGQYQAALSDLTTPQTPADWYNQGNILARQGELEKALSAYDTALAGQPDFDDARYNRKLVHDLLEQQKQQAGDKQNKGKENPAGNQQGEPQNNDSMGNKSPDSNSETSKGGSKNKTDPEEGSKGGSAQNGYAQDIGSQDPANASKQHAKNNARGSQASADNSSDEGAPDSDEKKQREQLQQQLKKQIDEQLSQGRDEAASDDRTRQKKDSFSENSTAATAVPSGQKPLDEEAQVRQQMLNRVEDDPAELWRRKFIYQYRQRSEQQAAEEKQW